MIYYNIRIRVTKITSRRFKYDAIKIISTKLGYHAAYGNCLLDTRDDLSNRTRTCFSVCLAKLVQFRWHWILLTLTCELVYSSVFSPGLERTPTQKRYLTFATHDCPCGSRSRYLEMIIDQSFSRIFQFSYTKLFRFSITSFISNTIIYLALKNQLLTTKFTN